MSTARRTRKPPTPTTMLHAESEAGFQAAVVDLAHLRGWVTWHDQDSRKNDRGLPDLIICRPPRLLFAELKVEEDARRPKRGTVRLEQWAWLSMLAQCPGVEVYLWRPSSWKQIEHVLM